MGISINEPTRASSVSVVMDVYEINDIIDNVSLFTPAMPEEGLSTWMAR